MYTHIITVNRFYGNNGNYEVVYSFYCDENCTDELTKLEKHWEDMFKKLNATERKLEFHRHIVSSFKEKEETYINRI